MKNSVEAFKYFPSTEMMAKAIKYWLENDIRPGQVPDFRALCNLNNFVYVSTTSINDVLKTYLSLHPSVTVSTHLKDVNYSVELYNNETADTCYFIVVTNGGEIVMMFDIYENAYFFVDNSIWKGSTNKRCINCNFCEECVECVNCRNCTGCSKCTHCTWCRRCSDSSDLGHCTDCRRCKECISCNDCNSCTKCNSSTYLTFSHNCSRCHYCEDVQHLSRSAYITDIQGPCLLKLTISEPTNEPNREHYNVVVSPKTTKIGCKKLSTKTIIDLLEFMETHKEVTAEELYKAAANSRLLTSGVNVDFDYVKDKELCEIFSRDKTLSVSMNVRLKSLQRFLTHELELLRTVRTLYNTYNKRPMEY